MRIEVLVRTIPIACLLLCGCGKQGQIVSEDTQAGQNPGEAPAGTQVRLAKQAVSSAPVLNRATVIVRVTQPGGPGRGPGAGPPGGGSPPPGGPPPGGGPPGGGPPGGGVQARGNPNEGLEVAVSRFVSGLGPDYRWRGVTDSNGRVTFEIVADGISPVSGYYSVKATDPASGEVVGTWHSISINGGKVSDVSLPIGGKAEVNAYTLPGAGDLPPGFERFSDNVDVYLDGGFVVLRTNDVPDHSSPYFGEGDTRYVTPHAGMVVNPNRIAEQNYVFRIPLRPTFSASPVQTNLDAIGIAVNGVVLFNQYAGRTFTGEWVPLEREIETFDIYNGHPAQRGNYHYHLEPVFLTQRDNTALVGWALDGFPIYGPNNPDGTKPADLDASNGEFGPTPDYPEGIYHYHITDTDPFILGSYRGIPGTVTN